MVAPSHRNAMPDLDALILKKREQLAAPALGFAHTRAIADRCFVERLPRLDTPLLLFESAVHNSKYGFLHATLCNRKKDLILLTANTVATMNGVFK